MEGPPARSQELSIEENPRRAARYLTAAGVLAVHVALIAALMLAWRPGRLGSTAANAVQLVYLAPVAPPPPPQPRTPVANLRRRGGGMNMTVAPPAMDQASFPAAAVPGSSNGEGTGVDWAAEARRALQAFEIRHHQPAPNQSVSGGPEEEHWHPGKQHHAGEKFKNANGDWIVWIDANCYEIASAGSRAYAHVAPLTEPVCQDQPDKNTP
jgi:hypothetical protein